MKKLFKIKIVVIILMAAFLSNDIVLADPGAPKGGPDRSLQIESKLKPMDAETKDPATLYRNHLEMVLSLVERATEPHTTRIFDSDAGEVTRVYDYEKKYKLADGRWVVPCAVKVGENGIGKSRSYEAVIDTVKGTEILRETAVSDARNDPAPAAEYHPEFMPVVEADSVNGLLKDLAKSLWVNKSPRGKDEVRAKVIERFNRLKDRQPFKLTQPYLFFDESEGKRKHKQTSAIIIFRSRSKDDGATYRTIGYRIPLNRKELKDLQIFVDNFYVNALIAKTYISREEYEGKFEIPGEDGRPALPAEDAVKPVPVSGPVANAAEARFLRDIKNPEEATRNLIEGIISRSVTNGKIALVFDRALGGLEAQNIRKIFKQLKELKKNDKFGKLLENLEIDILPSGELISGAAGRKNEGYEVFLFSRLAEKTKAAAIQAKVRSLEAVEDKGAKPEQRKGRIHLSFIDENQIPAYENIYYPIVEIVVVRMNQCMNTESLSIDELGTLLKEVNIEPAVKDDVYIFTILPSITVINPQERKDRYDRIIKAIRTSA